MRYRRRSFIFGWFAVGLLAIAGFAAFSQPDPTTEEIRVEAAAASMGHTSGAYAGLGFVLLGDEPVESIAQVDSAEFATSPNEQPEEPDTSSSDNQQESAGTIASPASGWLSQVEVRALVSIYFDAPDVNRAIRIAWCESRFDPEAMDLGTGAVGLFKHLPRYWEERAANAGFAGAQPTDPEASVAAAAWAVYDGGGWDVFTCRG